MKKINKYHTAEFWRGVVFPPLQTRDQPIKIQSGLDLIKSSLIQILNTRVGERILNPLFGSSLGNIQWDPNDEFLVPDVEFYIREAIDMWEPRVNLESVEVLNSDYYKNNNQVSVKIEFTLVNSPTNLESVEVPILIS